MPTVDLVAPGFTIRSDQTRLGLSTIALVRGTRTTIVDAGQYGRRGKIQEGLRALGVAPEAVDGVVFTHLHWDHMQNFDLFPNATLHVHPAELEYARGRADWATMRYVLAALADRKVETLQEGDQLDLLLLVEGVFVSLARGRQDLRRLGRLILFAEEGR